MTNPAQSPKLDVQEWSFTGRDRVPGRTTRHIVATLALTAGVMIAPARAAPVPWNNEPLTYTVVDEELRDLLTDVGTRLGTRVRVSDAVKARVRGKFAPAPPQEFIDRLASIYGFEWFYDGGTLWVTAQAESRTSMFELGPVSVEELQTSMDELGITDDRFPLRSSEHAGVVVANGPPRFVSMVEETIGTLRKRAQGTTSIRVVHLSTQ